MQAQRLKLRQMSNTKNMGNSLLNVNFTGGEPFARKDIIEIAKAYISNTTIESIYVTTILYRKVCQGKQ